MSDQHPSSAQAQERERVLAEPRANPDDPIVRRPPQGRRGPRPGPNYLGIPGRAAIVQDQVFFVALIVIVQLWLVTDALSELLSGRPGLPVRLHPGPGDCAPATSAH